MNVLLSRLAAFTGESTPALAIHPNDTWDVCPDQFGVCVVVGGRSVALVPYQPASRGRKAICEVISTEEHDARIDQQMRRVEGLGVTGNRNPVTRWMTNKASGFCAPVFGGARRSLAGA